MNRLRMDNTAVGHTSVGGTILTATSMQSTNAIIGNLSVANAQMVQGHGTMVAATGGGGGVATVASSLQGNNQFLGTIDCYEDVFKEITKKLYGDESGAGGVTIADVLDASSMTAATQQQLIYDAADLFRQDVGTVGAGTQLSSAGAAGGLAIVAAPGSNGFPPGTILVQRRIQDEKGRIWTIEGLPQTGDQISFATVTGSDPTTATLQATQTQQIPTTTLQAALPQQQQQQQQLQQVATGVFEERWFESDEQLTWTESRIARYNPTQKVFRCVDCDFVGFLSRVAEHWLGNHADLRVFQCPRCPYTSAWARCVRMHLTRQHGETLTDNSLWKENPVLEEVTKFLTTLKTKVEQKSEPVNPTGEKRYMCPCCPYQTDRRDLYNRHENIHRDEKPFQCYVCDKQFNRADHVKKHFIRMHRDHNYDINKIRKASASKQSGIQFFNGSKMAKQRQQQQQQNQQQHQFSQQGQMDVSQVVKQEQVDQMAAAALSLVQSADGMTLQMQSTMNSPSAGSTQQLPHIAYFNPPTTAPGVQNGPLQGISGVGGQKREGKPKGHRKKKSSEKMYTCSYCPWQGVDNWCLKRHLNTHIKPFLCALCDYKAARSERLATHVLKVHNKRVCHKCSYLADDSESLSQHIQDSHQNPLVKTGFNCNICQEYFELRADLEAHAILEHQKVIVQCDLCDFRTTDELSMEAHLRDKHNLTPGMGAVAAAAAAAAAAAIGQSVNTQYMQSQSQPQINMTEPVASSSTSSDQLLSQQTGVITSNPMATTAQVPSASNSACNTPTPSYPGTPTLTPQASQQSSSTAKLPPLIPIGQPVGAADAEPETLCEKCGIDFVDEQSRKLHERRHVLVNPTEDETIKGAKAATTKRFVRTYVCSTCSYTCATKKMMMQHQRAHTGFELVCQAENCMFSTPFENTLKEHIQNDHGSEEHVRCPHCGLRMPSSNGFTSHLRLHHTTICSLCVNVYRSRYDVKENDIHDLICKISSSSPTHLESTSNGNTALLLKMESLSSADFQGLPGLSDNHRLDDLTGIMIQEGLDEPLMKRPKLADIPSSSVATLYKRESIKFLPRIVEVKVVPLPPKIKRKNLSRRRKRKWSSANKRLHPFNNNDISESNLESSSGVQAPSNINHTRNVNKMLRQIQFLESSKSSTSSLSRVSLRRRYCQRGTFSWLYRNSREGFKCFSSLCENKCSWRYPRKVGLTLHNLWYHRRIPRFKCDICGLQFVHLYQAFLHKIVQHDHQNQALVQVASTSQQQHQQLHHQQVRHFSQTHLAAGQNTMLS